MGEMAHAAVPDLKEAEGGLRDATVLKALVATWLVDVPHVELERCRQSLLDVRDVLHDVAGRSTDRIAPELWDQLAAPLGVDDAPAVQAHVRELGRRITHISRLTWRRVGAVLERPASVSGTRRPSLTTVAPGVAVSGGGGGPGRPGPARRPTRCCCSARRPRPPSAMPCSSPATAARLVRECPALPTPWPAGARQLLVRLLAAGRGLLAVWETLEETGALDRILPEWERIRMLPHASAIHRFTVDRHVVETCIEASALIREVARPDVLMVAALLHDIGKGGLDSTTASRASRSPATIATRMGFDRRRGRADRAAGPLAPAAGRDRDHARPRRPGHRRARHRRGHLAEALALLSALTVADAKATSAKAWSTWRATLVRQLAQRCLDAWSPTLPGAVPGPPRPRSPIPREVRRDPTAVRSPSSAVDRRLAGDRDLWRPGRPARRRRRPVRAAADLGPGRPRLGPGRRTACRCGRSPTTSSTGGAAATDGGDRRGPPRCPVATVPASAGPPRADRRRAARRPRAGPPSSRSAMDDRPGVIHLVCTALADLDLVGALGAPVARWARRPWTCSTSRSTRRVRCRRAGRSGRARRTPMRSAARRS